MKHRRFVVLTVIVFAAIIPAGVVAAAGIPGLQDGELPTGIPGSVLVALISGVVTYLVARLQFGPAAKKSELDELVTIIDEMRKERENTRADYRRVLIELEQEREKRRALAVRMETFENLCADKDRELESLRCEVETLRSEIAGRDQRIAELTVEVEELRALVERLGGQPPRKKAVGR